MSSPAEIPEPAQRFLRRGNHGRTTGSYFYTPTRVPDATFTLRLSHGDARGFVEDGQGIVPKGTRVAPFTKIGGAYKHAAEKDDTNPYRLPESWMKNKGKVNLATPLNFTSTPDIIGGNSGTPMLKAKAAPESPHTH